MNAKRKTSRWLLNDNTQSQISVVLIIGGYRSKSRVLRGLKHSLIDYDIIFFQTRPQICLTGQTCLVLRWAIQPMGTSDYFTAATVLLHWVIRVESYVMSQYTDSVITWSVSLCALSGNKISWQELCNISLFFRSTDFIWLMVREKHLMFWIFDPRSRSLEIMRLCDAITGLSPLFWWPLSSFVQWLHTILMAPVYLCPVVTYFKHCWPLSKFCIDVNA